MSMRVIGLMSGTSYDAIDVAAADFRLDGGTLVLRPLGSLAVAYGADLQAAVAAALPPNGTSVEAVCQLATRLGHAYAGAAARGLAELCDGRADLVVSHGQTVHHWVRDGRALGTLQLGQPAFIAENTGLPVLSDLRSADVAAGGQGAPLVPVFDALLMAAPGRQGSRRAALNLGGIANITVLGEAEGGLPGDVADWPVVGYDTGPANALIDAACMRYYEEPFDVDGRHAAAGEVRSDLLDALLADPYYAAPAPKSTGKERFHTGYLDQHLVGHADLTPDDVIATVTEVTARTVADELRRHRIAEAPTGGGGLRNPVLIGRIEQLADCAVTPFDRLGIPADAKEAYAFALLGWLSWHGLPGALPSVTGARRPAVLGSLTPAHTRPPLDGTPPMPRRLRIDPVGG